MRLNLLRVPSFLAVNAATSSTEGTCGLPATARNGTEPPKPTPSLSPSLPHSFPLEQAASHSFSSGTQQPLTLIWVAARVTFTPLPAPLYSLLHHLLCLSPPSLRKSNPFIYLKFCRHFALIYILGVCFLGRKCGTAHALPCPTLPRPALPCPLCVCSCATCQTFVAAAASHRTTASRAATVLNKQLTTCCSQFVTHLASSCSKCVNATVKPAPAH